MECRWSGFYIVDPSELTMSIYLFSMPDLLAQANVQLSTLQQTLSAIPEPIENADATTEVLHRLDGLCSDLNKSVYGLDVTDETILADIPSYVQENRNAYKVLKKTIRGTAPDFRPYTEHEGRERILYDDDDDDETTAVDSDTASQSDTASSVGSVGSVGSVEARHRGVNKRRVYNLKDVRKVIE